MDQRDSRCPRLPSSETTAKGTGLGETAGKEDPVELDSSPCLYIDARGVAQVGAVAAVKYHYRCRRFTYPVMLGGARALFGARCLAKE